jgi:hypothetical protein
MEAWVMPRTKSANSFFDISSFSGQKLDFNVFQRN